MGVKKSTVCTRAHSGVSLYTPASSAVSNPISTFSSAQRGTVAKTWSNNFGPSLDAQPAAFTWAVSLRSCVVSSMRPYYNNGDAIHCTSFRCLASGIGFHAGFKGAANRPAPEDGVPRQGAKWVDPGAPGGDAGRNRVPARVPAGAGN